MDRQRATTQHNRNERERKTIMKTNTRKELSSANRFKCETMWEKCCVFLPPPLHTAQCSAFFFLVLKCHVAMAMNSIAITFRLKFAHIFQKDLINHSVVRALLNERFRFSKLNIIGTQHMTHSNANFHPSSPIFRPFGIYPVLFIPFLSRATNSYYYFINILLLLLAFHFFFFCFGVRFFRQLSLVWLFASTSVVFNFII